MIKLTVLYNPPADPAAFDAYYFGTHVPLANKLPGLARMEVSKLSGSLDGSPAPYHLAADLYFASTDALMAALGSPEGAAVAADVANYAQAGVSMFVGELADL
jgi:uncharacterized protein (TIGR02118 family)